MKIGFIQPWDACAPPETGGSLGVWTWEVARRLAQSNEVIVCCLRSPRASAYEMVHGVRFYRFSTQPDNRLMQLMRRGRFKLKPLDFESRLYYCLYLLRAALTLRANNCHIIHIFNLSQFAPAVAHLNPQAKIVLNMHCDWLAGFEYSSINHRLNRVDGIFGCAEYITNQIRSRFPHYAQRCETVHNGADLDTFRPRQDSIGPPPSDVLLTVGRISPEKGLHVLLAAFAKVLERKPGAELRIIGAESIMRYEAISVPQDNSRLREVLNSYGRNYLQMLQEQASGPMRRNVSFIGALPYAQIAAEMRDAVGLVQPSLYDLFPLPVIEAMAAGLPVVASRVGGLTEIVSDGETGLLVEPEDPGQLAETLMILLNNPAKARSMGAAGRACVINKFSWESTVNKLEYYYKQLG